jgi:hypothetical protein
MPQVVIENPVINSPFNEPARHFRFTDEGITNETVEGRRRSQCFVPIAKPKKKGSKQLQFDTEWTQDRIEENELVNQIRARVRLWREGGYVGVTPVTASLLAYWTAPDREKKLFFCQIEALETAIYILQAQHGGLGRCRDDSPVWPGYPLLGCTSAEPDSVSPGNVQCSSNMESPRRKTMASEIQNRHKAPIGTTPNNNRDSPSTNRNP